jgi:hypothetical protein
MLLWGLWAFAQSQASKFAGTFGIHWIIVITSIPIALIEWPIYKYLTNHFNEPNPQKIALI